MTAAMVAKAVQDSYEDSLTGRDTVMKEARKVIALGESSRGCKLATQAA